MEKTTSLSVEPVIPAKVFLSLFNKSLVSIAMCLLLNSTYAKPKFVDGRHVVDGKNSNALTHEEEVALLTRYEVKQGHREKFGKMLDKYVRRAGTNGSNIMAEAYYEQENPAVLWVIERWSSKIGLDKFRKSVKLFSEKRLIQPAKTIYVKDLEPMLKNEWQKVPQKDDKPITIMLFVDSKVGTEDDFKKVYHTAMPQFRSEPGVINYQLSQLEEDSTQFVTYEKFRSEDAFLYHLSFPPIQPVIHYLNTSIKKQPFQTGLHRLISFAPKKRQ